MAKPRSGDPAAAGTMFLARSLQDPDAFAGFYETYVTRISVYFMRRVLDPEVTVDLTAETFARALECRRQFRGSDPEHEQGWLFAIARSLLRAYWRRGRIEQAAVQRLRLERRSLDSEDIACLHREAGLQELRVRLTKSLAAVTPDQAAAISARVLDEREYEEIAEEFRTTPDVVRARVSRGLKTLQGLLGEATRETLVDA